jgi:hypothetical protein
MHGAAASASLRCRPPQHVLRRLRPLCVLTMTAPTTTPLTMSTVRSGASAEKSRQSKTSSAAAFAAPPSPPSPPSLPPPSSPPLCSRCCTASRPSGDDETSTPMGMPAPPCCLPSEEAEAGVAMPTPGMLAPALAARDASAAATRDSSRRRHMTPLASRRDRSRCVRLRARWPLMVRMCSAIRGRHLRPPPAAATCGETWPEGPAARESAQRSACSTAGAGRIRAASSGPKRLGRVRPSGTQPWVRLAAAARIAGEIDLRKTCRTSGLQAGSFFTPLGCPQRAITFRWE